MLRTVRIYKVMCQVGIGFAGAIAVGGCSDQDKGAMSQTIGSAAPEATRSKAAAESSEPSGSAVSNPAARAEKPAADSSKSRAGSAEASAGRSGLPAQAGQAAPSAAGRMSDSAGGTGAPESAEPPEVTSDAAEAYTFLQCPDAKPPAERSDNDFPACDGNIKCGGDAHCIPLDRLKMNVSETLIERTPDCTGGKCLPDAIVKAGGIQFNTCVGDLGEGRCVPQCFALWAEPLSVIFERGAFGCGSLEVCVPCNNPTTGEPSGACQSDMCGAGAAT